MSAPTAKPPTCRELLDRAVKAGPEDLGGLMVRAEAGTLLAARVEAVLKRHAPSKLYADSDELYCSVCVNSDENPAEYPCADVRLLNGERE